MTEHAKFGIFRLYGLFIMHKQYSIGVELEISSTRDPAINVLWMNWDLTRLIDETVYFANKIILFPSIFVVASIIILKV